MADIGQRSHMRKGEQRIGCLPKAHLSAVKLNEAIRGLKIIVRHQHPKKL